MRGHSTFPPDSYGEVIPAGATQYEKLTYMVYRKTLPPGIPCNNFVAHTNDVVLNCRVPGCTIRIK